jgi:methyl-accepting chemotaxis protein
VNTLIGEIALASDEQSKGISQLNHAVAELDRVTQQNAGLVQQVTTSANNLNARTEILNEVVSHFTLPGTTVRRESTRADFARKLIPARAQ